MSMLLLIGLVQSEMDEKGYAFFPGHGWMPKDWKPEPTKPVEFIPHPRVKRKYKK